MTPLSEIYSDGGKVLSDLIRKEWIAQGHHLTGTFESTLEFRVSGNSLEGYAPDYANVMEEGLKPDEVDPRVYQQLIAYFRLRGVSEQESKKAAFFTIRKWQQEGMPTEASKAYSTTGERKHFIQESVDKPEVDSFFNSRYDQSVDAEFQNIKNETI